MLIRTELVGREAKLAALVALLGEALGGGRPRVVLCEGERGIGKTRLAEELLRRATARGAAAVWGSGLTRKGRRPTGRGARRCGRWRSPPASTSAGVLALPVIVVIVLIVLVVKAIL